MKPEGPRVKVLAAQDADGVSLYPLVGGSPFPGAERSPCLCLGLPLAGPVTSKVRMWSPPDPTSHPTRGRGRELSPRRTPHLSLYKYRSKAWISLVLRKRERKERWDPITSFLPDIGSFQCPGVGMISPTSESITFVVFPPPFKTHQCFLAYRKVTDFLTSVLSWSPTMGLHL